MANGGRSIAEVRSDLASVSCSVSEGNLKGSGGSSKIYKGNFGTKGDNKKGGGKKDDKD